MKETIVCGPSASGINNYLGMSHLKTISTWLARKRDFFTIQCKHYDVQPGLAPLISSRSYHHHSSSIYKSLDHSRSEIRVLRIKPGPWNDDISCKLEKISLDRLVRPRYDTLSYTWGDARDRKSITVNGQVVDVSTNLCTALRALRRRFTTTTVWADALCINQNDLLEKGNQVAMMGRIYKQGRQTWISLGCPDEKWAGDSWSPSAHIPERAALLKNLIRGLWRLAWNHLFLRRSRRSRLGVSYVSDAFRLLRCLNPGTNLDDATEHQRIAASMVTWMATHDYWRRVWVVQEIALSKKDPICLFGRHQIPLLSLDTVLRDWTVGFILSEWWDDGLRSADSRSQTPGLSAEVHAGIGRAQEICLIRDELWTPLKTGPMELSRALQLASFRSASVAHDYIYGLRSLLNVDDQKMLHPHYNVSIPELYASMTKLLLRRSCTAHLLCAANGVAGEQDKHRLPSWVLDFSKPLPLPANRMLKEGLADTNSRISDEVDVLSIQGIYVGQQIVANVPREHILTNFESDTHGRKLIESFLDRDIYQKDSKGPGRLVDSSPPKRQFATSHADLQQESVPQDGEGMIFFTAQKRLGRCSHPVQPGDEVWMFEGSDTAFVLRPLVEGARNSEDKNKCRLVGPCIILDLTSDTLIASDLLSGSRQPLTSIEIF